MGSFSDYLENEMLDHLFGKGAYTPPTIWVGLSTADPLDDGSGLAEPSGNNYARVQTAAADWTAAGAGALDDGTLNNANAIEFATASGSWGTIYYAVLFDAETDGNMLGVVTLDQEKIIGADDTPRFNAGGLTVTLD